MEEHGEDHHMTNEFEAVANELEYMMNSTNLTVSLRRCIFKVPNILLRHNPKAYEPNAFSIGPYHYDKEHLKAAQKIKLRYLHDLVSSIPGTNPQESLRRLIGAISGFQQEARYCYAEPLDHISAHEFVKILVLDGCFLIELLRKYVRKDLRKYDDPIFTTSYMHEQLAHDLILLENQIPWRVLELLFGITENLNPEDQMHHLITLVLSYFDLGGIYFSRSFKDIDAVTGKLLSVEHESKHILDFLRNSLVLCASISHDDEYSSEWKPMPSATRLTAAGIKFEKDDKSSTSILDIDFKAGVIKIPPLVIHEITETLFRNLICLEQCLPNYRPRVTYYAILLDNLINTTGDMEILCKSGIIDNWLNIDDATKFFNQLYDDTCIGEFYYSKLIEDVNEYCGHRWPKYRTVLTRDYFKHPWALISVIAAAVLLILTFLQTVFAIIN